MKHTPHLLVDGAWSGWSLPLSEGQRHHLGRVLRLTEGATVTYTDGEGIFGTGTLAEGVVVRGEERTVPRPATLEVAVAPPASRDRQRFLVEKLAELGVARLRWIRTVHGQERLASPSKLRAWVTAAVEQSRGAWAMRVDADLCGWDDLAPPVAVCALEGGDQVGNPATVVVGPEGGFAPGEIPAAATLWDLGPTVLRVETAALVAVARLLA